MIGPSGTAGVDALALHMSDGLVDARASAWFFLIAVIGVGIAVWYARSDLDKRSVPTAALVTALVFALQVVDVPVLPDVSGHVVGAALAAILLGPFVGALAVTLVLVVQAFVFADGGLSALGSNVTNMVLIAVAAAFLTATALRALLEHRRVRSGALVLGPASFAAGFVSVLAAVTGFVVEYALGGSTAVPLSNIGFLYATHVPVGLVEGVVTAALVLAVARVSPESVYLTRMPVNPLDPDASPAPRPRPRSRGALFVGLGFTTLIVAGIVAPLAVDWPGALEVTTTRGCETGTLPGDITGECMAEDVEEHSLADGPLAGYAIDGRSGSTGIATVLGALGTFVLASVCFRALVARPVVTTPSRSDSPRTASAG
ncbi:energy-coupling factor ABC transporter permease [Rhodococcus sp. Z13]|uniref:Energy-coupling factor ABC transporter permease n=1 Tax=Rhodococcus sacchari TaxID=2962047 RepID=A0ACD4DEQ9_9NOCA|nr:energy-coupling factor ABC transporter permease [Rhodococcus sp. Z13]UYP18570.1 energy-coupling factor ABC transporter permease [Rhodococcus sp. Z13]